MSEPTEWSDRIGMLADRLDNLVSASRLPIPDSLHKRALQEALPDVVEALRNIYREMTGEDPWGEEEP